MDEFAFDNEITTEGGFQYHSSLHLFEIDGFCREIDELASEWADAINYIDKERLFVVRARAAVRSLQNTAHSETNNFILSLSEVSVSVKALDKVQSAALNECNDAEPALHLVVRSVKNSIESGRKSIAGFNFLCNKLEAFCVKLEKLCVEHIDQFEMISSKLDESVPLTEVLGLMICSVLGTATVTTAILQSFQIPNVFAIGAGIIAIGGIIVYGRITKLCRSNSVSSVYNKTFESLKATRTAINSFHEIIREFQKIKREPVALAYF